MDSTTTISENSNNIMNKPESFKKTGLGAHLKSAREAMRLTEKEAAARLHLNVSIITLIENENFEDGPPATFMRGYLRSYARLLNLSENEITLTLKDLESSMPSSITATPAIQIKPPKDNERYLHWLTYVIVLVLLMLVSVWWSSHSRYVIADVPPTTQATVDAKPATIPTNTTPAEPNTSATATTAASTQSATPQQKTSEPQIPATTTVGATPVIPTTALAPTTVAPAATSTAVTPPGTPTTDLGSATMTTPVTATPSETSAPTAATKPSKTSTLSKLKMALPEPDVDNNQDD